MLLRNAMARGAAGGVAMLVGLVSTPLLVRYLGQADFGTWLLLMSLVPLAGFLGMGLGSGLTKHLAGALARGGWEEGNRLIASCQTLHILVSGLVFLTFLASAWAFTRWLNIPGAESRSVRTMVLILGAGAALSAPARVSEGVLLALEMHHQVSYVESVLEMTRLGLIFAALALGGGLMAVTLAHTLCTLAVNGSLMYLAWRGAPEARWRPGWHWPSVKDLFVYGRDVMFINLLNLLRDEATKVVLGALATTSEVARYGVGRRTTMLVNNVVMSSMGVSVSRLSGHQAGGRDGELRELFLRTSLYAGLLCGWMGLGLGFLGGAFINLWVGPEFGESITVLHILLLPTLVFLAVYPCHVVLLGLGRHGLSGLINLGETVVALILAWVLGSRWGGVGVAAGLGLAMVCLRPWLLPALACRETGMGLGEFLRGAVLRAGLAAGAAWLILWLCPWSWTAASWPELIWKSALVSLAYAPAAWFLGFPARERLFWMEKVREKLDRS